MSRGREGQDPSHGLLGTREPAIYRNPDASWEDEGHRAVEHLVIPDSTYSVTLAVITACQS